MPSTADARMRPAQVQLRVRDDLTVERALDRLVEAARSVVVDQIAVVRFDVKVAGGRILRSAALLIVGALMLGGAWATLMLAGYMLLAPQLSPEERLALIALAHGLLGLGLVLAGARAMKANGSD